MKNNALFFIELIVSFLPFILFVFLNSKANIKKESRHQQYLMPVFAVIYSAVLMIFLNKLSNLCMDLFLKLADLLDKIKLSMVADFIRNLYSSWGIYLQLVLLNTAALLLYVIVKRILTAILSKINVRRNTFVGNVVELFYTYDEQDEVIARILFIVEKFWHELVKFSRRTASQLDRWAARYGYQDCPKEILKTAKGGYGRYACVNLTNENTIEFRIFRGSLKHNTLIAALQMVNRICNAALSLSDDEVKGLLWADFAAECTEPELIQYLQERKFYPIEMEV